MALRIILPMILKHHDFHTFYLSTSTGLIFSNKLQFFFQLAVADCFEKSFFLFSA